MFKNKESVVDKGDMFDIVSFVTSCKTTHLIQHSNVWNIVTNIGMRFFEDKSIWSCQSKVKLRVKRLIQKELLSTPILANKQKNNKDFFKFVSKIEVFNLVDNPFPRNLPFACLYEKKRIKNSVFCKLVALVFKLLPIFWLS